MLFENRMLRPDDWRGEGLSRIEHCDKSEAADAESRRHDRK